MTNGLPTETAEIHRRALDRRGRPFQGDSLPTDLFEIHAIALGRHAGRRRVA